VLTNGLLVGCCRGDFRVSLKQLTFSWVDIKNGLFIPRWEIMSQFLWLDSIIWLTHPFNMSLIPSTPGNSIKNWRIYNLYIHSFWDSRGNTSIHKKSQYYDLFHLVIWIQCILFGSIPLRFDRGMTNIYKELVIHIWICQRTTADEGSKYELGYWSFTISLNTLPHEEILYPILKVSLGWIQCNLNHGKWMIFDKVRVLHISRPWEHGLPHECEAYIWIWGLYTCRKNTIKILMQSTES